MFEAETRVPALRRRGRVAYAAFLVTLLPACGSDPAPHASTLNQQTISTPTKAADPYPNCLERIWGRQRNPDRIFDRRHDRRGSYSFSCYGETTPSMVQRAIDRLKRASVSRDPDEFVDIVHIPFMFSDRDGQQSRITSRAQFRRLSPQIFNDDAYRAIATLSLDREVIIVPRTQGMGFHWGGIWFVADEPGAEPKVSAIFHDWLYVALRPGTRGRLLP